MIIFCIKIPEFYSVIKFEIGKKYNAYVLPGLGNKSSKGYWIDDYIDGKRICCEVSYNNFVTLEEFRNIQIDKIIMKKDYEHWFPGDKIVCVNIDSIGGHKPSVKNLTIGKIYTIIDFETESPQILNDNNFPTYYDRIRFITLEEFREKQIDKIIG